MKHDLIIYCSREISEFLFCYRISVFRRIIGKSLLFPSLQLAPPQSLHDHHQASFVPVDRAWQPLPHSLPSPGTVDVLFGPNLTHQTMSMKKNKQPNNPHFLYSKQLFQTTKSRKSLSYTPNNPQPSHRVDERLRCHGPKITSDWRRPEAAISIWLYEGSSTQR